MNAARRAFGRVARVLDEWLVERAFAERVYPALSRVVHGRRTPRLPPAPASVRSVLVWNVDSIGDSLWITPVLHALREGYSQAWITLACNRLPAALFRKNPNVDEIVALDGTRFWSARGWFRPVSELALQPDVLVILEMGSRPADRARLLGRELGACYVVSSRLGLLGHLADHVLAPNDPAEYWPSYFLRATDHLGLTRPEAKLEVFLDEEDFAAADALLESFKKGDSPLVGLHPGVAGYANATKKWPSAHFVELATELAARERVRFVLTGSSDERTMLESLEHHIRERTNAETLVVAGAKLRALAALVRRLDLVVVGDTSVLHLAAAGDVPTLALFGATDPKRIAAPRPSCTAVTHDLACRPCHENRDRLPFWPTCIYDRPECLYRIEPHSIAARALAILATKKPA